MKVLRYILVSIFGTLLLVVAIIKPELINNNEFLKSLPSIDLLSLLLVTMTITLASVANIHLTITRIIIEKGNLSENMSADVLQLRGELNSNAWLAFLVFIITLIVIVVAGFFHNNIYAKAIVSSICMFSIILNIVILHDIYDTQFQLASISKH